MGINYHLGTHASTLEFGGQFRNEHKGQNAYSPTYDNGATPPMTQFLSSFTNPHFYGGSYYLPPVTNFDLITSYLAANISQLPLDEATAQVAPTILKALGLDPEALDAVSAEHTAVLPEVSSQLR